MREPKQAVVVDGHTLGVILNGESELKTVQVLRSSVLRGSPYTIEPGLITAKEEEYKLASKQDFNDFRVLWHPDYAVVDQET